MMTKLFNIKECKDIEKKIIGDLLLSEDLLINRVSSFVFDNIKSIINGKDIFFVVGRGNNGSDALGVALRSISVAKSVKVLCLFEDGNDENTKRRNALDEKYFVKEFVPSDVIIDGIFGFGFHGEVENNIKEIIDKINNSSSFVISLDVPSAFLIKSNLTFTFTSLKTELFMPQNRNLSGKIIYYDLGLYKNLPSSNCYLLEDSDYSAKKFESEDYKNKRGHILLAGGSKKYPGAIILSSLSSFHTGGGLVTLLSSSYVKKVAIMSNPSLMVTNRRTLKEIKYDSAILGPGWEKPSKSILKRVVKSGKNFLLDSGAFSLLDRKQKFGYRCVITPHLGEERRILSFLQIRKTDVISEIVEISKTLECIVVLKTSVVYITNGKSLYIYDGENPSLGVAGSGDILSGIIGSFLSLEDPLKAAIDGVILHQMAGKVAKEKYGYYSSAELIKEIGKLR